MDISEHILLIMLLLISARKCIKPLGRNLPISNS